MRIIEQGTILKYKIRCYQCKSLLEYENKDIKHRTILKEYVEPYAWWGTVPPPRETRVNYINCPCCGSEIQIYAFQLQQQAEHYSNVIEAFGLDK